MASVIVVEDEAGLGRGLRDALATAGHHAEWVPNAEQGLKWIRRHRPDLAILDVRLPGMTGLELLTELADDPDRPASIVITAYGDIGTAVKAIKLGAEEFLTKPVDLHALLAMVERTEGRQRSKRALAFHRKEAQSKYGLHRIIGRCEAVQRATKLVRRIAELGDTVVQEPPNILITGDTGTGKDLLARAFHVGGARAAGPFVHVNCAALPEALVESELFGHAKGAFTDARSAKIGLFELANDGTLYLDELGQVPIHVQAKLLTAIETRAIRPVGSVEERPARVQIIAAMNQPVQQSIDDGTFREDLFHRLRVIHAHLPPLRERGSDVELLIDHFMEMHCARLKVPRKTLTADAAAFLHAYHWPGHIRELHHWLESAVLQSGDVIHLGHLPMPLDQPAGVKITGGAKPMLDVDWSAGPIMLEEIERQLLSDALARAGGNLTKAAKMLGLTRYTMRYRAAKHGLG